MTLTRLAEELEDLNRRKGEGELILRNNKATWNLQVFRGKLLYATDQYHCVRRWDRALRQHCPNWNWSVVYTQLGEDRTWECRLIDQGINQQQLSLIRAKLVIRNVVLECLFDLSSYTNIESNWQPAQSSS